MKIPALKSNRLLLRALQPEDAPAIEAQFSEPMANPGLARALHPDGKGHAAAWISAQATGTRGIALAITEGDRFLGTIGLEPSTIRSIGIFAPTIGYWLGAPFWGKGFMQEAVRCLLDWYLPFEPTERIGTSVFEANTRSLKVLEKLGFREVGRGSTYSQLLGKELPDIKLELTAQRYYEAI
nr:GNAT family N-acetyltransferase [uncultured Cohaesibacter sp.]